MLNIKNISLTLLLFVSVSTQAQSIDSLKLDTLIRVLTLEKSDVRTVNAYMGLADEYIKVMDYSIALTYSELAKDLSKEIDYHEGEIEATLLNAHIYLAYYLDYKRALYHYDRAYEIAIENDYQDRLLEIYKGYSSLYASIGEYDIALEFNQKAIGQAKLLIDDQLVSDLNAYSASMYEEQGDTAKALEHYEEVLKIETDHNFMHSSKAALIAVAHYYFLTGEIDKSLDLYRSAITRFERLLDYRWVAYAHAEIAKVYLADKNLKRAEKHALLGLDISKQYELNKEKGDNLKILASIYKSAGDHKNAKKYQGEYDKLMDSLMVDLSMPQAKVALEANSKEEKLVEPDFWKPIINTIIILLLVGFTVVISGFVFKTSGS